VLVILTLLDFVCVDVSVGASVAMTVPLIRESSNVEVAVTVIVRSVLVGGVDIVPFEASDKVEKMDEEVIVEVSSGGNGVVTGDVIVCCDESVALPMTVVSFDMPGMVTDIAVVIAPTSVRETTAPVVAAANSVTLETLVPSFTLTSTTLAVTVASGALGNRYIPAFLRGKTGRGACWYSPNTLRLWKSDKLIVRVGCNRLCVSSPCMPISEVKSPSVILDPESRGSRTSGSVIFIRFAGLSMMEAYSICIRMMFSRCEYSKVLFDRGDSVRVAMARRLPEAL
jgi:hypothetical protein